MEKPLLLHLKMFRQKILIFSDPKHIMASMVVDAYLKDDKNDADVNQKVKEKLANCINTAVRNRFGLI